MKRRIKDFGELGAGDRIIIEHLNSVKEVISTEHATVDVLGSNIIGIRGQDGKLKTLTLARLKSMCSGVRIRKEQEERR